MLLRFVKINYLGEDAVAIIEQGRTETPLLILTRTEIDELNTELKRKL